MCGRLGGGSEQGCQERSVGCWGVTAVGKTVFSSFYCLPLLSEGMEAEATVGCRLGCRLPVHPRGYGARAEGQTCIVMSCCCVADVGA